MRRLSAYLFLATLALLPWGGLLRLPSLHENAQWSDLVCAAAVAAWLAALRRRAAPAAAAPRARRRSPSTSAGRPSRSSLVSPRPVSGPAKLVGMGMLVALFVLTSELMEREGMAAAVGRTVAATSVLTALAAAAGVMLSLRGVATPLVGGCGDLLPAIIPRAQAGFSTPEPARELLHLRLGRRRARGCRPLARPASACVQVALALTVVLTTSRAILGFALAVAIRHATTPARRRARRGVRRRRSWWRWPRSRPTTSC